MNKKKTIDEIAFDSAYKIAKNTPSPSDRGQGGKRKAGAPKGNKNGIALKDADMRQLAYQSYCDHLSQGRGKKSWFFELGEFHCSYQTMEKYIEDTIEFSPHKKYKAEAKGFSWWENLIRDSASGANTKSSTATIQMYMRNVYGWDKEKKQEEVTQDVILRFDSLMKQLDELQSHS